MTAVLTDIEGTTTDIAFVHDVLFPYARERLPDFLRAHADTTAVRACLAEVRDIAERHVSLEEAIRLLIQWSDEDRKIKPLKTIQGLIWTEGYKDGSLKAHIYADVAPVLRRWHDAGIKLYVYSSGSVAAQKLLFAHTDAGDLTPLFSGYFDTGTGPKIEAGSYRMIVQAVGEPAAAILFLSDNGKELEAAHAAGLRTVLFDRTRDAGAPPSLDGAWPVVSGFHQIDPGSETGIAPAGGAAKGVAG